MSEQLYRHDSNVPVSKAQWIALQEFKRIGVLVPAERCEHGNYARHEYRADDGMTISCDGAGIGGDDG